MEKICNICKISKDISCFGRNKKKSDGMQAYCLVCSKVKDIKHYRDSANRRINIRKDAKRRAAETKAWVNSYLKDHPCTDCKETNIVVLEFDHVRGEKKQDISRMVNSCSIQAVKEEIGKCEVRCANCHRMATYLRRASKA